MRIAHIINPVKVGITSDLYKAQPITFDTMRGAKEFARDVVDIDLLTTQYPEDHKIIPDYFKRSDDLERSVMDVGTFKKRRKLPLIKDLLELAIAESQNANYIIYTNVDIALQPHFYLFVKKKIDEGLDAFVINRRTLSNNFDLDTLPEAYSSIGEKHPGFDCFVFKKELLKSFNLGTICIGANWIGRTIYANLLVHCNSYTVFKEEHLTFHIGEDGTWLVSDFSEFDEHNKEQLYKILNELKEKTTNYNKLKELDKIKVFMDKYGSNPQIEKTPYNPSTWTLFKKKVKKIIKIIFDKN